TIPQADLPGARTTRHSPLHERSRCRPGASGGGRGGRVFMQALEELPLTAGKLHQARVAKMPDDALINSIAVGDKRAMVLLFMRHNVRIHRFVMRLTGKASIAEDIVSDVFLDIWRGAAEFSGKSNVSTWLLGIARNKAMSTLRRRTESVLDYDAAVALVDETDDT